MSHPVDTLEYWVQDFTASNEELESLYEHMLGRASPSDLEDLAATIIRMHIERMQAARSKAKQADGVVYRPNDRFEKGQKVVFPMLDGQAAKVEAVRSGNNPDYGEYDVIRVTLEGRQREFAAGLDAPHRLTAPEVDVDPEAIASRFSSIVAPSLATQLSSDPEWVHYGDRWILKGLLPEVNAGHCNLAEAIIMVSGEPKPTSEIVPELELEGDFSEESRTFAVVRALSQDDRFRNVGALEAPLWALTSQMDR